MDSDQEEKTYLWAHFVFNAEQRLKAFNFFVIFSVFADGGLFSALDKDASSYVIGLIGCFICLLAVVFFLIDLRSQTLLRLSVPGLKEYEKKFPDYSRLFTLETNLPKKIVRYTVAFRILFVAQLLFGLGVVAYAVSILI